MMNDDPSPTNKQAFSASSFVRAHLWHDPLYLEDRELWAALLAEEQELTRWFRETGLELVVDRAEGYAFVRQIEAEGEEKVPRLMRKQKLTYEATLLLVCLRDELNRFDVRTADQERLIMSRNELLELAGGFLPDTTDQMRDVKKIDAAIESLRELGFLRRIGSEGSDSYEVRRIIRARFGPGELEAVKAKLQNHVES
jgi:hypothetical protein